MLNLSYETAAALLNNIEKYTANDFDALGVTRTDMQTLTQNSTWRREQLYNIMRTFDVIQFGTLEILAMPKIDVPAEFTAAVIVALVHPCNIMTATCWLTQEKKVAASANNMSQRPDTGASMEPTSQGMLFALCCLLANNDKAEEARTRMGIKLGLVQQKQKEQEHAPQPSNRR